jgi:hypothetical protein
MVRLTINVQNIVEVLQEYDQIKVFRADTESGVYLEVSGVGTRPVLDPAHTVYSYTNSDGETTHWYKTSYFHSVSMAESALSGAMRGGSQSDRIGWSFGNYAPPPGEWGRLLTADDMRYFYLWGVDVVASDMNMTDFPDEQFDFLVDLSIAEFERYIQNESCWKSCAVATVETGGRVYGL